MAAAQVDIFAIVEIPNTTARGSLKQHRMTDRLVHPRRRGDATRKKMSSLFKMLFYLGSHAKHLFEGKEGRVARRLRPLGFIFSGCQPPVQGSHGSIPFVLATILRVRIITRGV